MNAPAKPVAVYSPVAHHSVWALLLCTLVLLGAGALVTTLKAGMAVPDWPTTFGHNMFFTPLDKWLFHREHARDITAEHSHRLIGSFVGLVTIVVVGLFAAFEKRSSVRWWAAFVLVLVIAQGVLGGFRVRLHDLMGPNLAMLHACLAQIFFMASVILFVVSSKSWIAPVPTDATRPRGLPRFAVGVTLVTYLQVILGAIVRHFPSAHAVYAHVTGAIIVSVGCLALATVILRYYSKSSGLRGWACGLVAVLLLQVTVGVATYIAVYGWAGYTAERFGPAHLYSTVAHLLLGSALLGVCTAVTLLSFRLARAGSPHTATANDPAARNLEAVR